MNNSRHTHRPRILIPNNNIKLTAFLLASEHAHTDPTELVTATDTVSLSQSPLSLHPVCSSKWVKSSVGICIYFVLHVFRCGCLRFESPVWKCNYMKLYVPRCVACSGSEGVRTNSHDKLINEQTYYPFGPVPRIFRARETTRRSASVLQSVAPWRLNSWDMVRMNWKRFFAVVVVVVHSLSWVGRSDYWHDYLGICSADGLRVDCVYSGICTTMCDDEWLDVEEAAEQRRRRQMCLNVEIRLPLHGCGQTWAYC